MGFIKEGTIAQVSYGRHQNHSVLIVEDRRDNPLAFIGGENNYSVMFISGEKAVIHGDDLKGLVVCPLLEKDIPQLQQSYSKPN
jgi:hypothetical protein